MNIFQIIEADMAETHWQATDTESGEILTWKDGEKPTMKEGRTYRTTKIPAPKETV